MPRHTRVYTEAGDTALAVLPGCPYKILSFMVNRADGRGICYPTEERISDATGYNVRHVQRNLIVLEESLYIMFVRRDQFDPITRKKLPNVYQISPDYICLSPANESEARSIWQPLIDEFLSRSSRLPSRINNKQEPLTNNKTNVSYQTPITNINNQRTKTDVDGGATPPADYANQAEPAEKNHNELTNIDSRPRQRAATTNKRNAPAVTPGSAAAGPGKLPNPKGIHTPLAPDYEAVAERIRGIGIALALARGFVKQYDVDRCQAALSAVGEAILNASADRPAGLFRYILQQRLADETAARAANAYAGYRTPGGDEPEY